MYDSKLYSIYNHFNILIFKDLKLYEYVVHQNCIVYLAINKL